MKLGINLYVTLGLISLSAAAISQELALGEGYAYDTTGQRVVIANFPMLWQDPDTKKVFSPDGRIFILKGKPFQRKLDYNGTVLTECSEVDFFSDPLSPPTNREDLILNEGDCRLYEMNEFGETADIVHMDSEEQVFDRKIHTSNCGSYDQKRGIKPLFNKLIYADAN